MSETTSAVDDELSKLLDSPRLQALFDIHAPSPAAAVVHSKAQLLQIRCQGLAEQLDGLISDLQEKIEQQKEQIISDLESIEDWMARAYALVLLEPNRYLYPENIVDEGSLRVRSEDSSLLDEEEWQGHGSDVSQGEGEAPRECGDGEEEAVEGGVPDGQEGGASDGNGFEEKEYDVRFSMSLSPENIDQEEGDEGVNENGGGGVNGIESDPSQTGTMTSGEEGSSEATQSGDTGE